MSMTMNHITMVYLHHEYKEWRDKLGPILTLALWRFHQLSVVPFGGFDTYPTWWYIYIFLRLLFFCIGILFISIFFSILPSVPSYWGWSSLTSNLFSLHPTGRSGRSGDLQRGSIAMAAFEGMAGGAASSSGRSIAESSAGGGLPPGWDLGWAKGGKTTVS